MRPLCAAPGVDLSQLPVGVDQTVHVGPVRFRFREGESIRTECSYKYTLGGFRDLAARAGLDVRQVWTDDRRLFSVQYLTPAA